MNDPAVQASVARELHSFGANDGRDVVVRESWAVAIVIGLLASCAIVERAECEEGGEGASEDPGHTALEFRLSPLLGQHHWVWHLAFSEDCDAVPETLEDVVGAARRIKPSNASDWDFGGVHIGFELAEAVLSLESGRSMEAVGEDLRLAYYRQSGETIEVSKLGNEYLRALLDSRSDYLGSFWPAHRVVVEDAARHLEDSLVETQGRLMAYLFNRLGIEDPGGTIPVYWLWRAPNVTGLTVRLDGHGPACLVDLADAPNAAAYELIVHEILHALDMNSRKRKTLFRRVRESLQYAGETRGEPWLDLFAEGVLHVILSEEAREAVCKLYDPAYEASAHLRQFWDAPPALLLKEESHSYLMALSAARDSWRSHLMGFTSESEAIESLKRLRPEGGLKLPGADRVQVRLDIMRIASALLSYAADNGGAFPESLSELMVPDEDGVPYLEVVPCDPWGNHYGYEPPAPGKAMPRVTCYGADGRPGGEGENADFDDL